MPILSRRPRLTDVAKLARVSPAVVSMVVNKRTDSTVRIGPETAERVWAAVHELGYVPNPVARSLARGRNKILGVFTYEPVFPVDMRSFYYPFLVGIEQGAEEQGYDLLLFTSTRDGAGRRKIYRDGVNRLQVADGAVLLGWPHDRSEVERLATEAFPFSYVGRREIGDTPVSYAAADYAGATRVVVEHLAGLGHRDILYLASLEEREANVDRQAGFRQGHEAAGLPLHSRFYRRTLPEEVDRALLEEWLAEGFTALVVEDDSLAKPILKVAEEAGLSVPAAFSLAVLGDPLFYTEETPEWTTFRIPRNEMGRQAARLLIEMLEGPQPPEPRQVVLPCTFMPGPTTGSPQREGVS